MLGQVRFTSALAKIHKSYVITTNKIIRLKTVHGNLGITELLSSKSFGLKKWKLLEHTLLKIGRHITENAFTMLESTYWLQAESILWEKSVLATV